MRPHEISAGESVDRGAPQKPWIIGLLMTLANLHHHNSGRTLTFPIFGFFFYSLRRFSRK